MSQEERLIIYNRESQWMPLPYPGYSNIWIIGFGF